jgi:hypothetical protein
VGGELTIFEFQGNKLLEGATNLNTCRSNLNFNYASGDQTIVDHRVCANTVIIVRKVVVEKSRFIYETIGCCTVIICCTVVMCCIILSCALVFR